jgi:hypothetical protein
MSVLRDKTEVIVSVLAPIVSTLSSLTTYHRVDEDIPGSDSPFHFSTKKLVRESDAVIPAYKH